MIAERRADLLVAVRGESSNVGDARDAGNVGLLGICICR
jgi:hypothetical protein